MSLRTAPLADQAKRDDPALAQLPEAERKDWQKLWADVQRLLDRTAATAEKKP